MRLAIVALAILAGCPLGNDEDEAQDAGLDAALDALPDGETGVVENECAQRGGSCMLVGAQTFCGGGHEVASYPCAATQGNDVVCCMPKTPRDAGPDAAAITDAGLTQNVVCAVDGGTYSTFQGATGYCRVGPATSPGTAARDDAGTIVISGDWLWSFCPAGHSCSARYPDRWSQYHCRPDNLPTAGQCITVNCGTINCAAGSVCVDAVHGVCSW
jgi:hypothetical protein